ncbi:MAG: nucleotidyl transferase AbiEii/AbiGii toxin family protein [Desulfuromonadales bacterium]
MEEEFCRPATIADLMNLIKSLNGKGAQYILIGGYALYAHGIHRATEDIDILVPAKREAAQPIIEALMMLPDKTANELEAEWFEEGENIRLADEFVVDLILSTCQQTYDTLNKYTEVIEVDGTPITTLNIEGLLLTKQSMRDKDVMDRRSLEIILDRMNDLKSASRK